MLFKKEIARKTPRKSKSKKMENHVSGKNQQRLCNYKAGVITKI